MRERGYVLVTLHRPSNVDDPARLAGIVQGLEGLAAHSPVVFPIHPRTRARLAEDGGLDRLEAAGVACIEPVAYLEFLSLQAGAGAIVTDSGGVQEEASALGVSCFTFRPNTERPVTLTHGTNVLLGEDPPRSPTSGRRRTRRRRARSRSGTATPASGSPTRWSRTTRW